MSPKNQSMTGPPTVSKTTGAASRRTAILVLLVATLALAMAVPAAAGEDEIYTARFSDVAIKGYDPVAYFKEGQPVKGEKSFAHEWKGAEWRFASAANRDAFAADPDQWSPQYGGYCAWAVSQGYTAGIDPEAWTVVGDKLYLNYNKKVQKQWEEDRDANIAKADANWPGVLD